MDDSALEVFAQDAAAQHLATLMPGQPEAAAQPAQPAPVTAQPEPVTPTPGQPPAETPAVETTEIEKAAADALADDPEAAEPAEPAEGDWPEKLEMPWDAHTPTGTPEISDEKDAAMQARIDELLKLDPADSKRDEAIWNAVRNTKRGRQFYNEARGMRELAAELGDIPSTEELKEFREARTTTQAINQDIEYGGPEEKQRVYRYLFGKGQNGEIRPGVPETLAVMPEALHKIDPGLYAHVRNQWASNEVVPYLEYRAKNPMPGDDPEQMQIMAENLYAAINGKDKWRQRYGGRVSDQPNGQPPVNGNGHAALPPEYLQELERLRYENDHLKGSQSQAQLQSFEQEIDKELDALVEATVFKGKNVEPGYKQYIAEKLRGEMRQAVLGDRTARDDFEVQRKAVLRSGDPQSRQALIARFRRSAGAALDLKIWPEFSKGLRKQSADTRAQSEKRHQTQQAAQAQVHPSTAGSPVAQVAGQTMQKGRNESLDDFAIRAAQQAMGSTG